jgi:hypothetical protein
MERSCESAQALTCRAVGPLATHLGAFVASLIEEQYVIACAYVKALHAAAFDRWLDKQGVALCDLCAATIWIGKPVNQDQNP